MKLYWIGKYDTTLNYREFERLTGSFAIYSDDSRERLSTAYRTYHKTVEEAVAFKQRTLRDQAERLRIAYERATSDLRVFAKLIEAGKFTEANARSNQ